MRKLLQLAGLAGSGIVVVATVAIAGSGVGGVFNLGQSNSVNATTTLTGAAANQLSVRTTAGGNSIAVTGQAPFEGVRAAATRGNGLNYGIFASTASPAGYAGYFLNTASASTYANAAAVLGLATGGTTALIHPGGRYGHAAGEFSGANGIIGAASVGGGYGIIGLAGTGTTGVYGFSAATSGVNFGVQAYDNSVDGIAGFFQNSATAASVAVAGYAAGGGVGYTHPEGTYSKAAGEFSGVNGIIAAAAGNGGYGVIGLAGQGSVGVFGSAPAGKTAIYGAGNAFISGNLAVGGTLTKGAGSFKIDDPRDSANKYLSHSFVESPDMMNIYNGNVTTDASGIATVTLPDYFAVLNRDPRYQLTVIGTMAQAIVDQEIADNQFRIRTSVGTVKVSWQVTGVRKDPYAVQHPIVVEEDKAVADRGRYLYPEGYGQPASLAIGANPQVAAN